MTLHLEVKNIIPYIIGYTLLFSNIEPAEAVCLPVPIVQIQNTPKESEKITRRISYKNFFKSREEILLLVYSTDPSISSNPKLCGIENQNRPNRFQATEAQHHFPPINNHIF